jgi:hypothetical protein
VNKDEQTLQKLYFFGSLFHFNSPNNYIPVVSNINILERERERDKLELEK